MNRFGVALTAVLTLAACERICVEAHRALLDGGLLPSSERRRDSDPAEWANHLALSQYRMVECRAACRERQGESETAVGATHLIR